MQALLFMYSKTVFGYGITTVFPKQCKVGYHSKDFSEQNLILTSLVKFWQLKGALVTLEF